MNFFQSTAVARPIHTSCVHQPFIDDDVFTMESAREDDVGAKSPQVVDDFFDVTAIARFCGRRSEKDDLYTASQSIRERGLNLRPSIFAEEWCEPKYGCLCRADVGDKTWKEVTFVKLFEHCSLSITRRRPTH